MSNQSLQIYTAEINDDRYPGAGFNDGEMENRGLARSREEKTQRTNAMSFIAPCAFYVAVWKIKCEAGGNILCVITFVGLRYGGQRETG